MDRIEDDLPPGVKVRVLSDASACDVTVQGFAGSIHVERSSLRVEGPPGLTPDSLVEHLKNGDHVIGLFQGMFDKNILTFNPGWDQERQKPCHVHGRAQSAAPAEGERRAAK